MRVALLLKSGHTEQQLQAVWKMDSCKNGTLIIYKFSLAYWCLAIVYYCFQDKVMFLHKKMFTAVCKTKSCSCIRKSPGNEVA